MKTYTVKYQVGTYSGTIEIWAEEDADHDYIIAKAKRILYKNGHPGMVYESFKVINE